MEKNINSNRFQPTYPSHLTDYHDLNKEAGYVTPAHVAAAKLGLKWPVMSSKEVSLNKIRSEASSENQSDTSREALVTLNDLKEAYKALGLGQPLLVEASDTGVPKVNLKPLVNHVQELKENNGNSLTKNVETMWPGNQSFSSRISHNFNKTLEVAVQDVNRFDSLYMRDAPKQSSWSCNSDRSHYEMQSSKFPLIQPSIAKKKEATKSQKTQSYESTSRVPLNKF